MFRLALADLDPIQLGDLKELCINGTLPRLKTLALFVQLRFCEPITFCVKAGVIEELVQFERGRPMHMLSPEQLLNGLRARKVPVIL